MAWSFMEQRKTEHRFIRHCKSLSGTKRGNWRTKPQRRQLTSRLELGRLFPMATCDGCTTSMTRRARIRRSQSRTTPSNGDGHDLVAAKLRITALLGGTAF